MPDKLRKGCGRFIGWFICYRPGEEGVSRLQKVFMNLVVVQSVYVYISLDC